MNAEELKSIRPFSIAAKSLTIQLGGQQPCVFRLISPAFWQSAAWHRYKGAAEPTPQTKRGSRDTSSPHQAFANGPGRPAPAAFLHHPRHDRDGRLCLAEG